MDMRDGRVIDALAETFVKCREMGIEVPDSLPLDTPEHRRMSFQYLMRKIWREMTGG